MSTIKFSAEKFRKPTGIEVRFALRGPVASEGIKETVEAVGFALAEDIANTYYAWAHTPEEATAIQNAIKPLVAAGKVGI